jgi:hypothetical protein
VLPTSPSVWLDVSEFKDDDDYYELVFYVWLWNGEIGIAVELVV